MVKAVFGDRYVSEVRKAFERLHRKAGLEETTDINGSLYVVGEPQAGAKYCKATLRVVWAGGDEPILETLGCNERILRWLVMCSGPMS